MKILIICENIAPQGGISTIRWTKLGKYLKINHNDVEVSILTTKKNYDDKDSVIPISRKDELLEKDLFYFDHYYDVKIEHGLKLAYGFRKKSSKDGVRFVSSEENAKGGIKRDLKIWARKAFAAYYSRLAYRSAVKYMRPIIDNFDVVISSYDPIWPHMAAAEFRHLNQNLVWIADFRDPVGVCRDELPGIAKWHKPYVKRITKDASAITRVGDFVSTSASDDVEQFVISNGFDPMERIDSICPEVFSIVFTGTIYGRQRDFGIVFRALNDLISEGKLEEKDVRVFYAGSNGAEAMMFARENNGEHLLKDFGLIPRVEAQRLQYSAAILLQASYNETNDESFWTGKMFEYMLSRKPIVYIVNGAKINSRPSQYMGKLGGVCYEVGRHDETYEELKQYIVQKYDEWKKTGDVSVVRDEKYISQFSHKEIAESVWEIIQKQIKTNNV